MKNFSSRKLFVATLVVSSAALGSLAIAQTAGGSASSTSGISSTSTASPGAAQASTASPGAAFVGTGSSLSNSANTTAGSSTSGLSSTTSTTGLSSTNSTSAANGNGLSSTTGIDSSTSVNGSGRRAEGGPFRVFPTGSNRIPANAQVFGRGQVLGVDHAANTVRVRDPRTGAISIYTVQEANLLSDLKEDGSVDIYSNGSL